MAVMLSRTRQLPPRLMRPNLVAVLTATVVVAWRFNDILGNRHGCLAQPERP